MALVCRPPAVVILKSPAPISVLLSSVALLGGVELRITAGRNNARTRRLWGTGDGGSECSGGERQGEAKRV